MLVVDARDKGRLVLRIDIEVLDRDRRGSLGIMQAAGLSWLAMFIYHPNNAMGEESRQPVDIASSLGEASSIEVALASAGGSRGTACCA